MTRSASLTWQCIKHAFLFMYFFFLPLLFSPHSPEDYMETVAMAQFKEVTGHEMKWLWILRAYSFGILWKNKEAHGIKRMHCLYFIFSACLPKTHNPVQADWCDRNVDMSTVFCFSGSRLLKIQYRWLENQFGLVPFLLNSYFCFCNWLLTKPSSSSTDLHSHTHTHAHCARGT